MHYLAELVRDEQVQNAPIRDGINIGNGLRPRSAAVLRRRDPELGAIGSGRRIGFAARVLVVMKRREGLAVAEVKDHGRGERVHERGGLRGAPGDAIILAAKLPKVTLGGAGDQIIAPWGNSAARLTTPIVRSAASVNALRLSGVGGVPCGLSG